ncbi:MAG: hypothetical protein H7263_17590 [Candidatus Sericytochromatia bacterium]|nr:hypothetical protein [Candidatus Sericytochromatia bacterium]
MNNNQNGLLHQDIEMPEQILESMRKLIIIYLIADRDKKYNVLFEANTNDKYLEKNFNELYNKGLLEIDKESNFTYSLSKKGQQEYNHILELRKASMIEYMIFDGVDIIEGRFAEDNYNAEEIDADGNLIWEDARVAVSMWEWQKNGSLLTGDAKNPWTIILLNHLSHGFFDQILDGEDNWQFDLVFGHKFFDNIKNIVNESVWAEDLVENSKDKNMIDKLMNEMISKGRKTIIERMKNEESLLNQWQQDLEEDRTNQQPFIPENTIIYNDQYNQSFYNDYYYYDPFYLAVNPFLTAAVFTMLF